MKENQGIERLPSKKLVHVEFRVIMGVIGFNLMNLFLNSEDCKTFQEFFGLERLGLVIRTNNGGLERSAPKVRNHGRHCLLCPSKITLSNFRARKTLAYHGRVEGAET